jgi:hypothetical protein
MCSAVLQSAQASAPARRPGRHPHHGRGERRVLGLATHLVPQSVPGAAEPPVADAVELLKVALAVGLSKWAEAS